MKEKRKLKQKRSKRRGSKLPHLSNGDAGEPSKDRESELREFEEDKYGGSLRFDEVISWRN